MAKQDVALELDEFSTLGTAGEDGGGAEGDEALLGSRPPGALRLSRPRVASKRLRDMRVRPEQPMSATQIDRVLTQHLGAVHSAEQLVQIRKHLMEQGPVFRAELAQLVAQANSGFLSKWRVFFRTFVLLLAFPLPALHIVRNLNGTSSNHRDEINRGLLIFFSPDRAATESNLLMENKQGVWRLTIAMLVAFATMNISLILGVSRVYDVLSASGNTKEILDYGNLVESIFPFLIFVYFAFQMAFCISIIAKEETDVFQEELSAARHEMEHASFFGDAKFRTSLIVGQYPLVAHDTPCNTCRFRHRTVEGQSVDLFFHLVLAHSLYMQKSSFWKTLKCNIGLAIAAFLLAVLPAAVRLVLKEAYVGRARDEDHPDWRDYPIVISSQIALFVTFFVYFKQCTHNFHECRVMLNAMLFFTALLETDASTQYGAVPTDGHIFFVPHVTLQHPHNVISWYVLRKYLKDVFKTTRLQMEVIVGIFIAALVMFFVVLLAAVLLGALVVKDVHLSVTALQAESIIIWGSICITTGMITVLIYGLRYNKLLQRHKLYLAKAQLKLLKDTYLDPTETDASTDFLAIVDNIKDNLERDDNLFTVFGFPLDSSLVKQIEAAILSLVTIGISSTLAFIRKSS
eukprot:m.91699 g.91699  ORF g.91699 m.91699 type:complete len:630 (-) comp8612_c0_seq1:2106-3995(-)